MRVINQDDAGYSLFVIPVAACALLYAAWRGWEAERDADRMYGRVSGEGES